MDEMMQRVNALNSVAQAIDKLSVRTSDKVVERFTPIDESPKETTDKPKELTLSDVRTVLAEKSRSGFKAEVKEMLNKHGAEKLSDIDPGEYEALMKEAEALGS